MSLSEVGQRALHLRVPEPPSSKDRVAYGFLGLLNCFVFGLGVIILGFIENDVSNMMIGVLQLLLPIVGWIWALVWGVLIVLKAVLKDTEYSSPV
ncbi:hypothetical protein TGME49_222260 [Toxoplasma gondii ME49]|uniref:Transmembrane protein n=7 Tax=Toxoplasma gondii TaxID=5811 RepID=S7UL79_TOXGG|nr:hypothetical protein TGME49_222260 [Toxoplasma gondii ME49]EPR58500.1 hypothetical protein TGGT1_222260 [Toxoplasma gondii GT1]KAF4645644.1 hypothetical protein TGRH88_001300 [Toxoplasma gondii]KFG47745.1 putative transmembrane protein [Toxoplasma gondii FOU]KYF42582.1 hypothetical protein TGARI_222260 [Toxoplasma gondii ARI]PIL98916.1 putative transmembrane protein [Toxoplasma gondii COUG]RQX74885.1 putative transmembrane protein [Toxoplasma gondii CAST]|eukprot:XP_018638310.1 hypothetical protein TGME49_222260 [Toxoplasma gondii ME49]